MELTMAFLPTAVEAFSHAKRALCSAVAHVAASLPKEKFHLAKGEALELSADRLREIFSGLSEEERNRAFGKFYELKKVEDPRISGPRYGEEHFWEDLELTKKAIHRCGYLGSEGITVVECNTHFLIGGESESHHSSYFSLGEKLGKEAETGWIGYINGMGTSIEQTGSHVSRFSDAACHGLNIHCVHLPTRQSTPAVDLGGFLVDAGRHIAVDGGTYSKASCLVAQQWIDYLTENPSKSFMQVCYSEGASHVNAALNILREARPDLLSRLRIITFCPAHVIAPREGEPLQVINLVKTEDYAIFPWGTGMEHVVSRKEFVQIVAHGDGQHPHNFLSNDYQTAAKPYIERFLATGKIFE